MTRTEFQLLAETFLDEAQTLLSQGKLGGAYYLARASAHFYVN